MTSAEKKRYLKSYRELETGIVERQIEYLNWLDRGSKVTTSITGVPSGGGTSDKVASAAVNMAACAEFIKSEIEDVERLRCKIGREIMAVEDTKLSDVLYLVYVRGYTLRQVAQRMHYTYDHVCRLHGYALTAFEVS